VKFVDYYLKTIDGTKTCAPHSHLPILLLHRDLAVNSISRHLLPAWNQHQKAKQKLVRHYKSAQCSPRSVKHCFCYPPLGGVESAKTNIYSLLQKYSVLAFYIHQVSKN
jgi:hypothetical protein